MALVRLWIYWKWSTFGNKPVLGQLEVYLLWFCDSDSDIRGSLPVSHTATRHLWQWAQYDSCRSTGILKQLQVYLVWSCDSDSDIRGSHCQILSRDTCDSKSVTGIVNHSTTPTTTPNLIVKQQDITTFVEVTMEVVPSIPIPFTFTFHSHSHSIHISFTFH